MNRARISGHRHFQTFPEIDIRHSLIGPGDAPPFMTYNDHGRAPVLLVADHASPYFPAAMNQLGLADWVLERHVAWDIGVDELTRCLADELDAPAVMAGFSRLIVDPNRKPDDPSAFPPISDGIAIPGNLELDDWQKALRIQSFFKPYHDAITARLQRFERQGICPAMIAVHTCTPEFDRIVRPWHVGVMWDTDPRLPKAVLEYFGEQDTICVGDNEPYSGRHPHDFTIDYHAEPAGLPHIGFEVRQDLVSDRAGARKWAKILAGAMQAALSDPDLYRPLEAVESERGAPETAFQ